MPEHTDDATVAIEVVTVPFPSDLFDEVVNRLWRPNRKTLGFLPEAGFSDRAEKGTLLAGCLGGEVLGYVLYDLPRDIVKIIHLCVDSADRGSGVARSLIDEVSDRHPGRLGLQLSCRRDYEANAAWPKLGFVPLAERVGRSKAQLPLTVWYREHGHPTLFTYVGDEDHLLPAAAMDHNIVIDLLSERPQGEQSRHLLDDWVEELVVLCATDESYQEIDRLADAADRERMRRGLEQFRRMPKAQGSSTADFEALASQVATVAPQADASDHNHLAYAIAGGAGFFLSRDGKVVDRAAELKSAFQITVCRPEQLISSLDRSRAEDRYSPQALNATDLTIESAAFADDDFAQAFLNTGAGEKKGTLLSLVRRALAGPKVYEVLTVRAESRMIGAVIRHRDNNDLIVDLLRISGSDRLAHGVARQLCFAQREVAAEEGRTRVRFCDPAPTAAVVDGLRAESFQQDSAVWNCEVRSGFEHCEPVATSSTELWSLRERAEWPLKILGAGIQTYVVPIRPAFAKDLFDTTLAAATLFGRPSSLGLSREHVYYRKPANSNDIDRAARILWYVSGSTQGQGEGHVRAISQLAEVSIDRPLTTFNRYERLGVYSQDQVLASADDVGQVMALRFVDTELFERPVSLTRLRELGIACDDPFTPTPSPRLVSEQFFKAIYEEASRYVG